MKSLVKLLYGVLVVLVGLALLADRHVRGIGVFRAIFSSTVATSVAVSSLMWLFLLQPELGALSNVGWLSDLFPVIKSPGLLRDPGTALTSVALSSVWASLGFTFILVTAGLQGIPPDFYEAAAVDGAGGLRRFWSITVPMLGPTLLFVMIGLELLVLDFEPIYFLVGALCVPLVLAARAAARFGMADRVSFVSTGADAALSLLQGRALPAVAGLDDALEVGV